MPSPNGRWPAPRAFVAVHGLVAKRRAARRGIDAAETNPGGSRSIFGAMNRRRPILSKLLALGLAAWLALPSLEWCPFASHCELGATRAAASCDGCDAAADGTGCPLEREARAATAAASCPPRACARSCALPCDPDPDPLPFDDGAWCIHPPVDGVPARAVHAPAPVAVIAVVEAPRVPPPPLVSPRRSIEGRIPHPAIACAHAPPQSRAPPHA